MSCSLQNAQGGTGRTHGCVDAHEVGVLLSARAALDLEHPVEVVADGPDCERYEGRPGELVRAVGRVREGEDGRSVTFSRVALIWTASFCGRGGESASAMHRGSRERCTAERTTMVQWTRRGRWGSERGAMKLSAALLTRPRPAPLQRAAHCAQRCLRRADQTPSSSAGSASSASRPPDFISTRRRGRGHRRSQVRQTLALAD